MPPRSRSSSASLLGDWKNPKPFKRIESRVFRRCADQVAIETPGKAQAFFVAGMNLTLRDDDPDYPALMLGNYILGRPGSTRASPRAFAARKA